MTILRLLRSISKQGMIFIQLVLIGINTKGGLQWRSLSWRQHIEPRQTIGPEVAQSTKAKRAMHSFFFSKSILAHTVALNNPSL